MAAFKDEFSKKSLTILADALKKSHPAFPRDLFLEACLRDLKKHELKGRVDLIAKMMKVHLPDDYKKALKILQRSAEIETRVDGFQLWPHTHFILLFGLEDFEASMEALAFFTKRFTAEFAIRPFFRAHPEKTLKQMKKWAKDEDRHLRRLASEGSRPLLPWGEKLVDFVKNPAPGLEILELLKHDSEEYVRKSVANHLNDFSKHHPDLVVETLLRWKNTVPKNHEANLLWIVKHASRTLLKKGHAGAMKLQGLRPAKIRASKVTLARRSIRMGEKKSKQDSRSSPERSLRRKS